MSNTELGIERLLRDMALAARWTDHQFTLLR